MNRMALHVPATARNPPRDTSVGLAPVAMKFIVAQMRQFADAIDYFDHGSHCSPGRVLKNIHQLSVSSSSVSTPCVKSGFLPTSSPPLGETREREQVLKITFSIPAGIAAQ